VRAFQANLNRLEAADTQVLGVSIDSPFANHQFALENSIDFPLLSDQTGEVARKYDVYHPMEVQGVTLPTFRRATFLIDKSGKIIEESIDSEAIDPTKIVDACERTRKG
jgi:peroxiredoxin Q/BCP